MSQHTFYHMGTEWCFQMFKGSSLSWLQLVLEQNCINTNTEGVEQEHEQNIHET